MLLPLALGFGLAARAGANRGLALAWQGGVVLLLLAAALTYSRAGFTLAVAASVAAWILLAARVPSTNVARRHASLATTALVAASAIGVYAWQQILARFDVDPLADGRRQYLAFGLDAFREWWPWGAGAGAFPAAYAPHEPIMEMGRTFALHAHDDLLEVAIELGLPGLVLVAAFLVLFACLLRRARLASASRRPTMTAAAIAACVPLVHSLVDYPLRTLAVAVLLALLLAELSAPDAGALEPASSEL
jgi:O-antigen ligase